MPNTTPATSILPPELWVKVIDHLRGPPLPWMSSSRCCGGTWHPAPGSSLGVVKQSITPEKGLIPLSAACKLFHDMLGDELQYTRLYLCVHPTTGQLTTHNGGPYPSRSSKSEGIIFKDIDHSVFGPSVRKLDLSLWETGPFYELDKIFEGAVPICDAVARDILSFTPNVVDLSVHLRVDSCGNSIPLSTGLARAIGSLQQLAQITFSGCHLPLVPDLQLRHVVRMQTNKTISSFEPFPALKELRNDQWWLDQEGYRIPVGTFARLEVLHFCQSDAMDEAEWFIEDCQAFQQYLSASSEPSRLRELVMRSHMPASGLREVVSSLASPLVRIFVSYGIFRGVEEYDDLLKLAIRAFPNAAIEFVDMRKPHETRHGDNQ